MIIQTARKRYLVIGYMEQDEQKEVCLCENIATHSRCLVIRITDRQLYPAVVEFLYEQVANEAFTDFQDCFISEETLLLVFSNYEGRELEQKLGKESCSFHERLEIVKKILERLILLDMPCYFASRCLQMENIFITPSLDISFRYQITDIEHNRDYSMKQVQNRLQEIIKFVFREELRKEVIEPLEVFLKVLAQQTFDHYLELYQGFLSVREKSLAISEQDLTIPRTRLFRIWDKLKALFKPLKRIMVLAVLIGCFLYMLWTIEEKSRPALSANVVDQIGTLKIE